MFTWQLYTCLSSYVELYDVARNIVASAPSPYQAEDALRDWVGEGVDAWFDLFPESAFKILMQSLIHNALGQVDWAHVAEAFDESSS